MYSILCLIIGIVSCDTTFGQETMRTQLSLTNIENQLPDETKCNSTAETHCAWIPHLPWKRRDDLFDDKPYDNSVDYFGIDGKDNITMESYLESPTIIACKEITLNFYSKISKNKNHPVPLSLSVYRQSIWTNEWEFVVDNNNENMTQWHFNQLKFNLSERNDDVQFRFIPNPLFSQEASIAIDVLNVSTYTNCLNSTNDVDPQLKVYLFHKYRELSSTSTHPFMLVIFAGAFLLIFGTIMFIFIYGLLATRYNNWKIQRVHRQRKHRQIANNAVGDEVTVLGSTRETA